MWLLPPYCNLQYYDTSFIARHHCPAEQQVCHPRFPSSASGRAFAVACLIVRTCLGTISTSFIIASGRALALALLVVWTVGTVLLITFRHTFTFAFLIGGARLGAGCASLLTTFYHASVVAFPDTVVLRKSCRKGKYEQHCCQ